MMSSYYAIFWANLTPFPLKTKVQKYAKQHGWKFDPRDFDFVQRDPELLRDPADLKKLAVADLKVRKMPSCL